MQSNSHEPTATDTQTPSSRPETSEHDVSPDTTQALMDVAASVREMNRSFNKAFRILLAVSFLGAAGIGYVAKRFDDSMKEMNDKTESLSEFAETATAATTDITGKAEEVMQLARKTAEATARWESRFDRSQHVVSELSGEMQRLGDIAEDVAGKKGARKPSALSVLHLFQREKTHDPQTEPQTNSTFVDNEDAVDP